MRTLLLATFLAGIPTAFAQDPATSPSKTQVLELLSGYEESASPDSLKALGTSVPSVLQSIASDGSLTHTQRARAVHALGWFPSEDTKSFLATTLTGSDSMFARKAAYALGNGWGDGAVSELKVALESKDAQLRIAAAASLMNVGTTNAKAAIEARLLTEQDASVKKALEAALGR